MPKHYGGGNKKTGMKKSTKKKTTKRAPPGFHRMPDGSLMKGAKHSGKKKK
jgi:hypothetical protein